MVRRVYVEKKSGFDVEAQQLAHELRDILGIAGLQHLRLLNRYDVEGIDDDLFASCVPTVFSEPQTDRATSDMPDTDGATVFAVEYLPGQFDQRAESAGECIQLISCGDRPTVRSAKVYALSGDLSADDIAAVKHYVINPVEAREAATDMPATLQMDFPDPAPVEVLTGFTDMTDADLDAFIAARGLAMDAADLAFCRDYFAGEGRDPSITEVKMIDTYWSDHCRHTTFGTVLDDVVIDDERVAAAYANYRAYRDELGRGAKPECLMDMGTIGARLLKARGVLKNLDESDEINACTVKCTVDVDGVDEDWLYLFKNETHNHPTEIEPFGGAATCLGGAIRDPLSGRSYVYQAMRVTGAADPTAPIADTIAGKLPQRKLVTTAAAGYSSYGNQIGLATGQVDELYHPGYAAKRMEVGAVVGATPANHVRREEPAPGDVVVLLGGRTGRDGIGGATGSSKAHNVESLESCGAEVQKGNPPVERKIQRLFRRADACRMIKRCNDFGAGGVSVAVGELADALDIDLDVIPKKYEGLDGTELAIAESQERMAVALAPEDVHAFLDLAAQENLEATPIATVSDSGRVRMTWRGDRIVDVSREFLNSNGAPKHARAHVPQQKRFGEDTPWPGTTVAARMEAMVRDLNVCSNKGLVERFDSTIGAATVTMPFGGARQLTPAQAMVAKFPVIGETTTVSGMAWGFNPYLSDADQFTGAYIAVVESVCKLAAAGFARQKMYLTFQEYFEKLGSAPERWGKPVAAVLGALEAQVDLGVGSIGGKDSMSGSFEKLDVPPTLVSFATATGKVADIVSPEFKAAGHTVLLLSPTYRDDGITPTAEGLAGVLSAVHDLTAGGRAHSVSTPGFGGVAEWLFKACLGNGLGLNMRQADASVDPARLFDAAYGSFIVEVDRDAAVDAPDDVDVRLLGNTTDEYTLCIGDEVIDLTGLQAAWEEPLQDVFPYKSADATVEAQDAPTITDDTRLPLVFNGNLARPRVVIPVFPGNNCEYDSAAAFERAGADVTTYIVNNLTPDAVAESTNELARIIGESQIVMIPGGFSGGDEPDGSAKFITAFFRSPRVTEAVRDLLQNRDGLMLGICNGFQALVKLGLVPFGDIRPMDDTCPTLTYNTIGRHQSGLVRTRVASTLSPWFDHCTPGDIHTVAISHGEGRFVASPELLQLMRDDGRIATQYVDADGNASMALCDNPNGSVWAIEGITSPDGRVLGKMGHSERAAAGVYGNVPGNFDQHLFEAGVGYFAD